MASASAHAPLENFQRTLALSVRRTARTLEFAHCRGCDISSAGDLVRIQGLSCSVQGPVSCFRDRFSDRRWSFAGLSNGHYNRAGPLVRHYGSHGALAVGRNDDFAASLAWLRLFRILARRIIRICLCRTSHWMVSRLLTRWIFGNFAWSWRCGLLAFRLADRN